MSALSGGDDIEGSRQSVLGRGGLAGDLEANDRGMSVFADLAPAPAARVERRMHVDDVSRAPDAANDVGDHGPKTRVARVQAVILDQDSLACRLCEAGVAERVRGTAGFAVAGI